ncbi:MAG: V-type ATP synthase subunit K [Spirochaetaceae bacterium]|nr:MAG: V-type ATP synthase subunit K [Spirochaetaceae bacterium]
MDIGFIGIAAAFTLSALGSALGIGFSGQAAVGAWKRCYAQNKKAPIVFIVYISAPITQTFYGYILMGEIQNSAANPTAKLAVGVLAGLAIGISALYQGKIGACAADAHGETGKGAANYIMALGVIESVAIFVMALMLLTISSLT